MLQSNKAHVPQLLSPYSSAYEPQTTEAHIPKACALQQEAISTGEVHTHKSYAAFTHETEKFQKKPRPAAKITSEKNKIAAKNVRLKIQKYTY